MIHLVCVFVSCVLEREVGRKEREIGVQRALALLPVWHSFVLRVPALAEKF